MLLVDGPTLPVPIVKALSDCISCSVKASVLLCATLSRVAHRYWSAYVRSTCVKMGCSTNTLSSRVIEVLLFAALSTIFAYGKLNTKRTAYNGERYQRHEIHTHTLLVVEHLRF